MLEDRQHNAFAALDIFQNKIRADSLSGDVARWQRAFDEAKRAVDPKKPPAAPTPRNDGAGKQISAEQAQSLNRERAGAAWSTGEGESKKWWTNATDARADAATVACTFILVDGSVDQVIPHTGAWQSIVAREVRDLKKMDCGKVTTKEYADETAGYARHDSVRKDAAPDAASLSARVAAALAAGELSAVTAASLKRAIAAGSFAVADAGLKSVGF